MISSCSALSGAPVHCTNACAKVKVSAGCRSVSSGRRLSVRVTAEAAASPGIETTGPNIKAAKDIQEIMDILPHR